MNLWLSAIFLAAMLQSPTAQNATPAPATNTTTQGMSQSGVDRIIREVHHELVLLPYYGVFDNLAYRVTPDGTVTLLGQATRPTLKSDAENSATRMHGAERVDNQIQLPP